MGNFNRTEEARRNRLSAMVDDDVAGEAAPRAHDPFDGRKQLREACLIRIDRIMPDPDQPRKEFEEDALMRLAESLRTRGQLQPIRVRYDEGRGVYVVVVGERRWRAAGIAGLETVACVVVGGKATAADVLEDQLVENALREDLKPVEQASAFRTLMGELGLTQRQLADKLQISQTTVSQSLSLLDLAGPVRARVDSGELAPSAAYQIAKVGGADAQAELAERAVAEGMTRAEVQERVQRVAPSAGAKSRGASKAKPKGKPARLPVEIKHRGSRGIRMVATTAGRHSLDDVIADLREFLGRLEAERDGDDQQAA